MATAKMQLFKLRQIPESFHSISLEFHAIRIRRIHIQFFETFKQGNINNFINAILIYMNKLLRYSSSRTMSIGFLSAMRM